MDQTMVMERPIVVLRAGVDAIGTVDPGDLSDAQLAGEVLRLRREMDRLLLGCVEQVLQELEFAATE